MRLKTHLQYERNFCTYMNSLGYHTERVAASGRRKEAVCDVVLFTKEKTYIVEVKSTRSKTFYLAGQLHGIVEVCNTFNCFPLLAVYFKSSHSSQGKGRWVIKQIGDKLTKVMHDDKSDNI